MKQKFANLGYGYLAQNIDAEETQFYVENMVGVPSINTGEFFVATIYTTDSFYGTNIEIVKVVQTDGNYWTVERNQEDTGAKEHLQGSRIELRLTADSVVQVYREGVEDRITSSTRSKTDIGFLPNEKGELQFDATTRTVTLVANDLPVYWFGKELKLNTVSIQFEDVAGGRYIILNPDTLELEEAGEYPSFEVLLVAYIHWSVEQQDFIISGDERHTVTRNTTWHRHQHLNEGLVWLSGGLPTYVPNDVNQVGISLTSPIRVADEDLEHLILHNPVPSNPFEQVLEGSAKLPVLWLDSTGHYHANTPTEYPFPHDGTGILVNTINELDSTGSLDTVPNGKFVSMFIMASHCSKYPVKVITGRVVSDTVAEARDESLLSYGINMPEFAYLYHLVYEKDDSVTQNPGKVRLVTVLEPARPVNSAAPNIGANDHQGLSNRTAPDSHPIGAISGLQAELERSKEWSESTVSKEEAEATSGESRRAWTVTRVLEAVQAWWNRSTMKIKLDGIEEGAQVNTVTSVNSRTGAVTGLVDGQAVGVGVVRNYNPDITLEDQHINGLGSASHGNRVPLDGPDAYIGKVLYVGDAEWGTQLWFSYNEGKAWFRNKKTGNPYETWKEFIHTGNIRTSLGYSIYPVSQKLVTDQLASKANSIHTHPHTQVTGLGSAATRNVGTDAAGNTVPVRDSGGTFKVGSPSDPEHPARLEEFSKTVRLTGDQTIEGVKTFSTFPITPSAAPTANYQVANKKYVDDASNPWFSRPIGEEVWLDDSNPAVDVPPTDNPNFRYVKLTAGENGSGGYNEGILINETVSGSAPLIEATAEINLPDSPFHGQTVRLLNTERRFVRAGEAGVAQDDQMQRITGTFWVRGRVDLLSAPSGAFEISTGVQSGQGADAGSSDGEYLFDSARSPDSRASATTDGETRARNIGRTVYMRIL